MSIINVIASIFVSTPSAPDTGGGGGQGDDIYGADAKGNKPKLGAVIPHVAGRRQRYPDYLLPIRKWYADKRTEKVEMMLCYAYGKHRIESDDVRVGNTALTSLGNDADFAIYGPGESMAGDQRRIYWHNSTEVGSTSSGNGIKLKTTYSVPRDPDASAYRVSGNNLIIPSGAGSFPSGWQSGMIVHAYIPQDYIVIDGGEAADVLEGDFTDLAPVEGMVIQIRGENQGIYTVASYEPGTDGAMDHMTLSKDGEPVTYLKTGSKRAAFGLPDFRYQIIAADSSTVTLDRLSDDGTVDESWPGFVARTVNDAIVRLDASTVEGDWAGAFAAVPENEKTDMIEWCVLFTQGLTELEDDGDPSDHEVTVELQYRDIAERGDWTSIRKTYRDATLDQIGFTERAAMPYPMRPEVRMRRIGSSDDTQIVDEVQWVRLKSRLDSPTSYEGVTCIAVTLTGGDKLSTASDNQISVIGTSILPVRRNGQWQPEQPTRDIAPFCLSLLQSVGYQDGLIGLEEWDRLDELWRARGDTLDAVFDDESTVKEVLKTALEPGMADFTIRRGEVIPVRDGLRSVLGQGYSPQNMTGALTRQYTAPSDDDHDYVEVEYTDARTWQKATVDAWLPGSAKRKAKKLSLDGVTDRTHAWRIGMREASRLKYQRFEYSWETELDGMNSSYLEYVPVSDDVPGYSQSAFVRDWERLDDGRLLLVVSEVFDWPDAPVISLRRPDGVATSPLPCEQIDDYQLICDDPGFDPLTIENSAEPTFCQFGTLQTWAYEVLVTDTSPSWPDSVSLQGVNYDERIYAYDDAFPPDSA
ncbi:host specificity factor TipJ family phage tail protein [Kushneria phosphatilytica]|uniref:host specificity factor TipJ family phage tail protein n=1 Tax=Kushneria phosphatilytica TaxID=657387 RepID=UPI0008DA568B|nr:host specificity factor TipJ family phage tail protein [Kushneria phosphatilytica]OHV13018.1 hypothetical protein BH688_03175 [Kushneria phosphatilytica]